MSRFYGAIELLVREPNVRRQGQFRSQVVLVDEFQDLTPAHVLMLRLLAGPGLAIFGVGDDDQTIYSYSGHRRSAGRLRRLRPDGRTP